MWFINMVLWSAMGMMVCGLMYGMGVPLIKEADGFEMVNPIWVYYTIRVNWFGAFLVALFFNALFPICSLGYWIYKLCTIGRR